MRVGLFPEGNDRLYYARFSGHYTREVVLDFASQAPAGADLMFQFQYPLVGKAQQVDDYSSTGAIWEKLVSFAQQQALYQSRGWNTDDYPGTWRPFSIFPSDFDALPNIDRIPTGKVIFEGEHPHAYGLSSGHYLSGDERLREAYADWGDYWSHFRMQGYNVETRGVAWRIFNLVDLYRLTGEERHRQAAWDFLESEVLDKTALWMVSEGESCSLSASIARRGSSSSIPINTSRSSPRPTSRTSPPRDRRERSRV